MPQALFLFTFLARSYQAMKAGMPRPCGRESKLFVNLIVFIVGITNRRNFVHWVKIFVTIEFY